MRPVVLVGLAVGLVLLTGVVIWVAQPIPEWEARRRALCRQNCTCRSWRCRCD